jgi:hypothetical protein
VNGVSGIVDFWSAPLLGANLKVGGPASTTVQGAPELDASGAGAALTLLIGMGRVLKGRRRG